MDWIDLVDRLELHDDLLRDQQVDSIPGIDSEPLVRDGQDELTLDPVRPRVMSSCARHASYADSSNPGPSDR